MSWGISGTYNSPAEDKGRKVKRWTNLSKQKIWGDFERDITKPLVMKVVGEKRSKQDAKSNVVIISCHSQVGFQSLESGIISDLHRDTTHRAFPMFLRSGNVLERCHTFCPRNKANRVRRVLEEFAYQICEPARSPLLPSNPHHPNQRLTKSTCWGGR